MLLLKGLLIGFAIAAPVGPIGLLCIQRTLAQGWTAGFITGLGAASADALYGSVAGFGLTWIFTLLLDWRQELRLTGGLLLLWLGGRLLIAAPAAAGAVPPATGWLGNYTSTFFLTLTNPVTILAFIGIFAGLGLAETNQDYGAAGLLVSGVLLGSLLWWLLLACGVNRLRHRLTSVTRRWISQASGLVIALFGVLALLA